MPRRIQALGAFALCEQHDALNDDSGDAQGLIPGFGAPKRHGIFRHRWQRSVGHLGRGNELPSPMHALTGRCCRLHTALGAMGGSGWGRGR